MNSKANRKNSSRLARFAVVTIVLSMLTAAIPSVSAQNETTSSTSNEAPSVAGVYYYTADPSAGSASTCASANRVTSFNPTAGSTTTVWVCVEATDGNGYEDICDSSALSTNDVRKFSVTNSTDVSISDASHPKADVALTCQTGSGTAVALVGSFAMEYWRPSTTTGSEYKVPTTITDVTGATAAAFSGKFNFTSLTSLDLASVGTINLGSALAPASQGSDVITNVYNKGNAAITLHVRGSDLTGTTYSRTIGAANLKYAATSSVAFGSKTALTGTSTSTGLSMPVETTDTPTARSLYFQLGVPSGSSQWIPADTYNGTVTFATG